MIKLLAFDLDNTLANLAQSHHIALNTAITQIAGPQFIIEDNEYDAYNGVPTKVKLNRLNTLKNLPSVLNSEIERLKQKLTVEAIESTLTESEELIRAFKNLKRDGYITACVSNSIEATILAALQKIGIRRYIDIVISNEHVIYPKPSPSPYLAVLCRAGVSPFECVCFEDSPVGMTSVIRASCHLCRVDSPSDLTEEFIRKAISLHD